MNYSAPGVYIKYVTDGPLSVQAESTSTSVFIGPTVLGTDSAAGVFSATLVTSLPEYAAKYATTGARNGVVCLQTASNTSADTMGHAVRGFFLNGGQKAYIISLSTGTSARASQTVDVTSSGGNQRYRVEALSDGAWGDDVVVTLETSARGQDFCDVTVALTVTADGGTSVATERFIGQAGADLASIGSGIVQFVAIATDAAPADDLLDISASPPPAASAPLTLAGGANADAALSSDMGAVTAAMADIDDISLIALPGRVWPGAQADYEAMIAHCQSMKDRMVLIQLDDATTDFGAVTVPFDKYAAVYYPSATVALSTPGGGTHTQATGVTAHVAGIFARTDAAQGAWTAPAGRHANIAGITTLSRDLSQTFQERMNPESINALRYIEGVPVVWGARTRDKGGIYVYVPVMRTAFLIADSLRSALNAVVFAKNTEILWGNVKAGVNGFMDQLYTQGAFQGPTPGSAFQVAVGLGESMTQTDIDGGLLRVTVRFMPAKPAEFIEVSVEQLFDAAS